MLTKQAAKKRLIGLDVGGANLKASLLIDGQLSQAIQLTCELWRGLNYLETALLEVIKRFEADASTCFAITMTGELVDLFKNREHGVLSIAQLCSQILGKEVMYYASVEGFVTLDAVPKYSRQIASANWFASASWVAQHIPQALFVDIGSTTTDIVPITNGKVAKIGMSDALRMQEDTLVYTGVLRTPVMALAQKLPFEGADVNVAAEYFATMGDVYRLTGDIQASDDETQTADGQGKSKLESARRLARMIGYDVEDKPLMQWQQLAETCKKRQMQQIKQALLKHLKPAAPIIGAGAGAFLVGTVANEIGCAYKSIHQLLKINGANEPMASVCFSAYAVAMLANQALADNQALANS